MNYIVTDAAIRSRFELDKVGNWEQLTLEVGDLSYQLRHSEHFGWCAEVGGRYLQLEGGEGGSVSVSAHASKHASPAAALVAMHKNAVQGAAESKRRRSESWVARWIQDQHDERLVREIEGLLADLQASSLSQQPFCPRSAICDARRAAGIA